MSKTDLTPRTAIVTGASRGFGRAITIELAGNGARVIGVARHGGPLEELRDDLGEQFLPVVGDATDAHLARNLIEEHHPRILVLNAGATPMAGSLREQTWESFTHNWEVDTQHVFHWTREALRLPLAPGSVVIALSSAAALRGSPLSGGYAGAKAGIRFISAYAAEESRRDGLGIRFIALLPQLTPATELGATYVAAYAAHEGLDIDTYLERFQPVLSGEQVAKAVVELTHSAEPVPAQRLAYLITGTGLQELT